MAGPAQPLSYTPPERRPASHAWALIALTTASASFAFLALAVLAARHRGPWPFRLLGRESSTIFLASAAFALAAVASLSAVLGWSKRRRGIAECAALAAAVLCWATFISAVVVSSALK